MQHCNCAAAPWPFPFSFTCTLMRTCATHPPRMSRLKRKHWSAREGSRITVAGQARCSDLPWPGPCSRTQRRPQQRDMGPTRRRSHHGRRVWDDGGDGTHGSSLPFSPSNAAIARGFTNSDDCPNGTGIGCNSAKNRNSRPRYWTPCKLSRWCLVSDRPRCRASMSQSQPPRAYRRACSSPPFGSSQRGLGFLNSA